MSVPESDEADMSDGSFVEKEEMLSCSESKFFSTTLGMVTKGSNKVFRCW